MLFFIKYNPVQINGKISNVTIVNTNYFTYYFLIFLFDVQSLIKYVECSRKKENEDEMC